MSLLRGRPLQRSLLSLVLTPVLGLTVVVGVGLHDRVTDLHRAERAVGEVRQAVALDTVRGNVAQEMVPVLGRAVFTNSSVMARFGVDTTALGSVSPTALTQAVQQAQERTEAAIAAARSLGSAWAGNSTGSGGSVGSSAQAAQETAEVSEMLRSVRAVASGTDLNATSDAYQGLLVSLGDEVNAHLRAARAQGLDGPAANALGGLQRVSRATTLGSTAFPLLLSFFASGEVSSTASTDSDTSSTTSSRLAPTTTSDGGNLSATARGRFVMAWAGYRQAAQEIDSFTAPAVVTAWDGANRSAAAGQVDELLTDAALNAGVPSIAQLSELTVSNTQWDRDQRAVLALSAAAVVSSTEAQAAAARVGLQRLLSLICVVVAVAAVSTWVVRRSIALPLARLAAQAHAVGDGELVDVEETGPVEVATVAQGLKAAVEGLRRVRAQVQAITEGDTDAEVMRIPLPGPLGEAVHASITQMVQALQERQQLQEDLTYQASHDALTKLPNRVQVVDLIEHALRRTQRSASRIGVLHLDLDDFKSVNDTHGRAVGDDLLRVVAARLHATVRGGDVVGRLGGDEFVVIVEPVEEEKGLLDFARRLIDALTAPIDVGGRSVRIGASVGITLSLGLPGVAGTHLDPEQLLADAGAATGRAKAAGRGGVEVFDEQLRSELAARAQMEAALRTALDEGELVLFYQPVLDLASGRTTSVEALVRWQRPGHGLVPPDAFIPVAEASSLICDLGCWALHEATQQLVRWDAEGGDRFGLSVAVNISGRHLVMPHLVEDVNVALAAAGIDPRRLTVEITETVLVDESLAIEHLRVLRELGVRIAIDDFGTGYTSIGQLAKLPVDVLKIDRSFVASQQAGHGELVRLLISAAHSLDLGVVAEGVEEDSQLAALLAAACDAAQGYLFARPVRADDLPPTGRSAARVAAAVKA